MKVIILAAGLGRRLDKSPYHCPKPLLAFGGQTLLERHLAILDRFGISDVSLVVGYGAELIVEELTSLGLIGSINLIENPRYREGSLVSLWTARHVLTSGAPVLLMDADVLYDYRLMASLLGSKNSNCLLLDRNLEPGDEPVKVCVQNGAIVDFHKRPQAVHDWRGESVGFFRLSPPIARELASRCDGYVAGGQRHLEYEEPIRDMILASAPGIFGFEDITGLPWTEIDFPEDVVRARDVVLPQLLRADVAVPKPDDAADIDALLPRS